MRMRSRAAAGVAASAVAMGGSVIAGASPAQAAPESRQCTVNAYAPTQGHWGVYANARASCNRAYSVIFEVELFVRTPSREWTKYGNPNADATATWNYFNGGKTLSVGQTREFCEYLVVAEVSYKIGGIRKGRGDAEQVNFCD